MSIELKAQSMETFNKYYTLLNNDLEKNGALTKKSALTSLLYLLNRCGYEAGDEILRIIERDASEDNALANHIMGHIFMYGYRCLRVERSFPLAREYFTRSHTLNPSFEHKQYP
jgi:hypothetical protein